MILLSPQQLLAIMPEAGARTQVFALPLSQAMDEFEINTPRRMSAFLATVAEESWQLTHLSEITDGKLYEPPSLVAKELGNTEVGDGVKFKGRGLGQATGRWMYNALATALTLPLLDQPELLLEVGAACRSAAWIWGHEKQLNPLADEDQFAACCYKWNGGYYGIDARIGFWLKARKVFAL